MGLGLLYADGLRSGLPSRFCCCAVMTARMEAGKGVVGGVVTMAVTILVEGKAIVVGKC